MASLRPLVGYALVALQLLVASTDTGAAGRSLSFDERVAAQRAIEEVYWRHRIWPAANGAPKPPLAKVLPDHAIGAMVEDDLQLSNALQDWWQRPVTARQLQAELDRMARDTSDPRMLRELFAALDDDAYLIAETLGRRALARRLARNRYANDERFHGEVERTAREALAGIRSVDEMRALGAGYIELTYVRGVAGESPRDVIRLEDAEWERWEQTLARRFSPTAKEIPLRRVSPLQEESDRYSVVALLAHSEDELTIAIATWPKRPFDEWWEEQRPTTSVSLHTGAGAATYRLTEPTGTGCEVDTWDQRFYLPGGRSSHAAVWTGTEMIIWGGFFELNTGGRYDPATETWRQTSTGDGVPSGRRNHTAVWTGTEMIVWGGTGEDYETNSGGRYDPQTDSWNPTSTGNDVPEARSTHTAVWTGTEMIVWGGTGNGYHITGGRYDPATDSWTATATGLSVPSGRSSPESVWTGTEMIVWGGYDGAHVNTGGRYDPATNGWTSTSVGENVPAPRLRHAVVWTGTKMIVWGGSGVNDVLGTGGRYDPPTDTWAATTMTNAPDARNNPTAVWTGTEMIIWGGYGGGYLNTGGRYDASTDSWTATSTGANTPAPRSIHSAVWTGAEMIVWGGQGSGQLNTGGRYAPATNSWVATSNGPDVPAGRHSHTAVWTGAETIVWGGFNGSYLKTGGRYDAATDTWMPTATVPDTPSGRNHHTAVWTGTEMIIWGGFPGPSNTGGRYNPSTDSWTETSTSGSVPANREGHSAVWTGTEMIVWGGVDGDTHFDSGGRYDPSTNIWSVTSLGSNLPAARAAHTAVWTGTEMMVWGGYDGSSLDSGGRYDPVSDSWTPTSTGANLPPARRFHTTVWTGTEMIVWGGYAGSGQYLNSGGRYDPTTDSWQPTATDASVPSPRSSHASVWSGSEMIIWGGWTSGALNSGGRYDPTTDSWQNTSTGANSPPARLNHTAVGTGTRMLVWGGSPYTTEVSLYCTSACTGQTTFYRDADGDGYGDPAIMLVTDGCSDPAGYVANADDCNDASAAAHPGAVEICDELDNDCNTLIDDGILAPTGHPDTQAGRSGETVLLSWPATADATGYDVVKGSLTILGSSAGDFTVSTTGCLANDLESTGTSDDAAVSSGDGLWYLVRPVNCGGNGTYDSGGMAQAAPRDGEITASALGCP